LFSLKISNKFPSPFTTPVFLSTGIIILFLLFSRISYNEYQLAKDIMTFLLGPATVALAVPLYKHRKILFQNLIPAFSGLFAGEYHNDIISGTAGKIIGISQLDFPLS
jgi:putative effector of murein hydrolase